MRCFWYFLLLLLPIQLNADTLRLLNWDAYLAPQVEKQWEKITGHSIEIIKFDSDENRDALLLEAQRNNIDIAVVDEIIAERFGKDGRFVQLTEKNLPGSKHMGPFWRERCGKHAVPYLWGTLGIIYRSDKVKTPPTSWKAILEPADEMKGHIGMMNDHTDLLAPALFLKGESLNTNNTDVLKSVFTTLKKQTDYVLTYEYPVTFLESSPKANELYMAVAYGGDQVAINEKIGQKGLWKYATPEEGTVLWVDCLAISAHSENKKLALDFLEYLNQPEIAAFNAEKLHYATPNTAALPYLTNAFKNDSEVFPAKEIQEKSDLYEKLSNENIKQRLRITNAIVNIHESKQTR